MALKLEFRLVGCANNVPLEVVGKGTVFGGLDWLFALRGARCGRDAMAVDEPVVVRSMTEILDEAGREAGESKMVLEARREGDTLKVHGELARCAVRMEVGERVAGIEPPERCWSQTTRTRALPQAWEHSRLAANMATGSRSWRGLGLRRPRGEGERMPASSPPPGASSSGHR